MYLPPYFFRHNTLFFEKIMCCGKFVTTHYFFKKYCVADMAHNTLRYFLKKNNVLWRKK